MKVPLPKWVRWLALAAGAMDAGTGACLVAVPAWTLACMGVTPPGAEALEYVRFVGAFVGAVGLVYFVAGWRGNARALRTVLDFTRVFRGAAGTFVLAMVAGAGWSPAWLSVTGTDYALVVVQTIILARYADE
ncbi:MAG TPA: hypothetical protein VG734_11120 [Lacunisphaera sp.]|nr:hypothetical protein [Lacunisphaera sp.]